MIRIRFVIAAAIMFASIGSVHAEPYSCSQYEEYTSGEKAETKAQYAKFCIDEQKAIIADIADRLGNYFERFFLGYCPDDSGKRLKRTAVGSFYYEPQGRSFVIGSAGRGGFRPLFFFGF